MAFLVQMNEGVAAFKFVLDKPVTRIGRLAGSEIFINNPEISYEHAIIERVNQARDDGGDEYYIQDLDSTNHSYVNDKQITREKLRCNDVVRIGWIVFTFIDETDVNYKKTDKIFKSWIPGVYYTKS